MINVHRQRGTCYGLVAIDAVSLTQITEYKQRRMWQYKQDGHRDGYIDPKTYLPWVRSLKNHTATEETWHISP